MDGLAFTDNSREAASHIFGWLSIGCWLIVYSPQIAENHQNQSGEGLSIVFVVIWLLGDFFNLVAGLMAGIIPTAILLALYYTLCDLTLLFQIYYYRLFYGSYQRAPLTRAEREPLLNEHSPNSVKSIAREVIHYLLLAVLVLAFGFGAFLYDRTHQNPLEDEPVPNRPHDVFEWKSQVMGWLSALLYLSSRIPQIRKNMITRCEGLSPALFLFAIWGNVFYVLSICVLSVERVHLITNASWLAGSGLTVFLDILVLGQFIHYRRQDMKADREGSQRAAIDD